MISLKFAQNRKTGVSSVTQESAVESTPQSLVAITVKPAAAIFTAALLALSVAEAHKYVVHMLT